MGEEISDTEREAKNVSIFILLSAKEEENREIGLIFSFVFL